MMLPGREKGAALSLIHDAAMHGKPPVCDQDCDTRHAVELEVMDSDGGKRHLLQHLESAIHSAAWSPDGETIAFSGVIDGVPRLRKPTRNHTRRTFSYYRRTGSANRG